MDAKRNLVLGTVRGYDFDQLRPFVVSLNRVKRDTDLVLLWNRVDRATLATLREHGVELIPFSYRGSGAGNSWRRLWPIVAPLARLLDGSAMARRMVRHILPLPMARFFEYRDFFAAHATDYRNALITDVRDVLFQDDPFSRFDGELTVFEEDANVPLADDRAYNARWVTELFGPAGLVAVGRFPVLCSGTIMGSAASLAEYLAAFERLLLRARRIESAGADQGLHNVLCRTMMQPAPRVSKNVGGRILTMQPGLIEGVDFCLSSDCVVRDPAGETIAVLHQYDRHPAIAARLLQHLSESER